MLVFAHTMYYPPLYPTQAATLPAVGPLHAAGLPLLLGSTGAMCVLLFGKPDAEPVRLWPLVIGQLASTAIAVAVFRAFGPGGGVAAKAAAMAAALAVMVRLDAVHPPGGALVLLALDSRAAQALGWRLLFYPSLATTLLVVLPVALAANVLKRRCAFDYPSWTSSTSAAPSPLKMTAASPPPPPPLPPGGVAGRGAAAAAASTGSPLMAV